MKNLKFKIVEFTDISNKIIEINFQLLFYYNKKFNNYCFFYYNKRVTENLFL
jgi:hypothetical protein